MRNDAQDPNLPRWIGDRGDPALSTPAAAATASTPADGDLSGRVDGPGRRNLSSSAAAAAASTPGAPVRRTRLIFNGRRKSAGRHLPVFDKDPLRTPKA